RARPLRRGQGGRRRDRRVVRDPRRRRGPPRLPGRARRVAIGDRAALPGAADPLRARVHPGGGARPVQRPAAARPSGRARLRRRMSLANPWALALLGLALPVVAAYLHRRRRTPLRVPSAILLRVIAGQTTPKSRAMAKPRHLLSLLLVLLALL